jgi:predicted phosphoribosyltransferase
MFHDRIHAAKLLSEKLNHLKKTDCLILAIPRGGVIVGAELAKILGIPLDVIISKKITPHEHPEYAIGAVTYDGVMYFGHDWERYSSDPKFQEEINKKKSEVARQIHAYRGHTNYEFGNKTVILVDDGIATGATVCAIIHWLQQKTTKIILATPVIPYVTAEIIKRFGVQIISLETPKEFSSVGQFYRKFDQIPDSIVVGVLHKFSAQSKQDN